MAQKPLPNKCKHRISQAVKVLIPAKIKHRRVISLAKVMGLSFLRGGPHISNQLTIIRTAHLRVARYLIVTLITVSSSTLSYAEQSEAARFLNQATLGFTEAHIAKLQESNYAEWIEKQRLIPPTLLEPYIEALASRGRLDSGSPTKLLPYHKVNSKGNNVGYRNLNTAWMRAVLGGDDQLRQRVTWALSQIIVTSNTNNRLTEGTSNYYDLLLKHAFSSYEQLLIAVTFHPVMGRYLSYMGNKKANASNNQQPDENYAREIMQLFSIGLWMLNPDGSRKLSDAGEEIPTYSNSDITELARVFTGLWISNSKFGRNDWGQYDLPMSIHARHHDKKPKSILNGYIEIPAGMNPDEEVRYAVSRLAQHPNVAPFLSKKLINHLITSNPSKKYVDRVSTVWTNTNGNLGKVVEAILLDSEARDTSQSTQPHFGRLKDPIQRLTNILIGFECGSRLGKEADDYPGLQWWRPAPSKHLSQAPMQAPSVFNFFESEYSRPGSLANKELYSPEFQILNDATASAVPNYIWRGLISGFHKHSSTDQASPLQCSFDNENKLSLDEILNKANLLLAAGRIDEKTLVALRDLITTRTVQKAPAAVFAIAISPNATIQQ